MFNFMDVDVCDFIFDDPIIRCTLEDYDEVRDAYIQRVSRFKDVRSIYQMGSISTPGISDLDLIIVLNDELKHSCSSDYLVDILGEDARYFFIHNPVFVNEEIFRNLSFLLYATNIKKVFGEEIHQVKLSSGYEHIKLAILIDHGLQTLHKLTKPLVCKYIYVRSVLPILYSVKYSIKLTSDLNIQTQKHWIEFIDEIVALRNEWLSTRDHNRLVHLIMKGISVVSEIMIEAGRLLVDSKIIQSVSPLHGEIKGVLSSYDSATIFTDHPERLYHPGKLEDLGLKYIDMKIRGKPIMLFFTIAAAPISFYYHFSSYDNMYGRYKLLKDKAQEHRNKVDFSFDSSYQYMMSKRVEIYNSYLHFAMTNRLPCGEVIFGGLRKKLPNDASVQQLIRNAHLYLILLINKVIFTMKYRKQKKLFQ